MRTTRSTILGFTLAVLAVLVAVLSTGPATSTAAVLPAVPVKRAIPTPVSISGSKAAHWCCRERGKCITTKCAKLVLAGVTYYGTKQYRTQDACISKLCSSVCVKTTRDCSTFFF
ncbi:hypothetical protein H9P43_007817 [Blastocladiella emersonii ATCC 22665]|nr:hypothetical protein H9P43_007817 [Blastocladiella emersonii ATCC 22665]